MRGPRSITLTIPHEGSFRALRICLFYHVMIDHCSGRGSLRIQTTPSPSVNGTPGGSAISETGGSATSATGGHATSATGSLAAAVHGGILNAVFPPAAAVLAPRTPGSPLSPVSPSTPTHLAAVTATRRREYYGFVLYLATYLALGAYVLWMLPTSLLTDPGRADPLCDPRLADLRPPLSPCAPPLLTRLLIGYFPARAWGIVVPVWIVALIPLIMLLFVGMSLAGSPDPDAATSIVDARAILVEWEVLSHGHAQLKQDYLDRQARRRRAASATSNRSDASERLDGASASTGPETEPPATPGHDGRYPPISDLPLHLVNAYLYQ
ncbi:hypothetical protein CXG81DRAFT_17189 [Caulochytrium protostelioides]|uniref:PIG-P domain-containing protein n=1 Tax=Caulochytrium protostelioides TaxID=1555241 RepID=A0A4P9XCR6_9FUNG|nr:hypothetical protein CXG81DRAFT_17189 [Caulochytrium protostelioides]|eukprot:RKP03233.1 hypothetical protein CXG81DRAFT_17189 [Caulochytrium protostelioides]